MPTIDPAKTGESMLRQLSDWLQQRGIRFTIVISGAILLCNLSSGRAAWGFISFGNGFGNKWGEPEFGTGAIVTWGFMADGTGVDPGFRIDPFSYPDTSGVIGTSALTGLRTQLDATYGEGAFLQAITNAFETWAGAADIRFVGPVSDVGLPINDPAATVPDIRIGAFHADPNHSFRFVGAVGFAPPYNGGTLAGDIILNLDSAFQIASGTEDSTPIDYFLGNDLEGLVLHELGHAAIGLAHPPSGSDSVMYVGSGCCQFINHALAPDDLAGAVFTYGVAVDLNRDTAIDAADAGLMFANWGLSGSGDLNRDNIVDAADAGLMFAKWTGDPSPENRTVPEPQLGCGLLGLTAVHLMRRRRFHP